LLVHMVSLVAEDIFQMHPQIRWAGLASEEGDVIFSSMRPGMLSYSPEADDRFLLELGGMIMDGVAQRSSQWLGKSDFVLVGYEKATQIIVHVENRYLALTVEPSISAEEILGIARKLPGLLSS